MERASNIWWSRPEMTWLKMIKWKFVVYRSRFKIRIDHLEMFLFWMRISDRDNTFLSAIRVHNANKKYRWSTFQYTPLIQCKYLVEISFSWVHDGCTAPISGINNQFIPSREHNDSSHTWRLHDRLRYSHSRVSWPSTVSMAFNWQLRKLFGALCHLFEHK